MDIRPKNIKCSNCGKKLRWLGFVNREWFYKCENCGNRELVPFDETEKIEV